MKLRTPLVGAILFCTSPFVVASAAQERIEITTQIPTYQRALSGVLPQQQVVDESSFSADSLATLLNQAPAINLNGQGGLFQTINIRGFARWRIQTLVEGIPIYTERRAGTSVEFLPPSFVGQAFLTQGAASTQLGSGAIGGGLDLGLKEPLAHELHLGFGLNQDYRDATLKGVTSIQNDSSQFSWLLNHRHANNSEDGNGNEIQDKFEKNSALLRAQFNDSLIKETFFLYSSANNIAKASADDPADRFTLYPENTHMLGKVTFDFHNAAFYFHDSKLNTEVTLPGSRINTTLNESLDLGFQMNNRITFDSWLVHWRTGLDARTGVEAFETEISDAGQLNFATSILDAEQWESYVAMDFTELRSVGTWVGGARVAYQYQSDNIADTSENDTNLSAFVGYAYPFKKHWKVSGYVSNAYRVPSLTERYFNGSTPRGTVLGDPNLETETAINFEGSVAFQDDDVEASFSLFHQRIDNYIERLRINSDLRQYRNLDSAEIDGINYQMRYSFDGNVSQWELSLGGQWLWGEDQSGEPIADISPAQHRLSLKKVTQSSNGFIALVHRASSDDIVSGELPTSSVTTIDAGYTYQFSSTMELSLNITNLTDKLYVTSRDDLAPFARGRDIHATFRYLF